MTFNLPTPNLTDFVLHYLSIFYQQMLNTLLLIHTLMTCCLQTIKLCVYTKLRFCG